MAAIEFSEEQKMLLDTAAEFCNNQSPIDKVRTLIENDQGFDAAIWQQMTDLGWLGVAVPEAYGGLGMGPGSVVPIVESMGYNLMATPYLVTQLATRAIVTSASESQKQAWLPAIVAGAPASIAICEPNGSWSLDEVECSATVQGETVTLQGEKTLILDLASAEVVLVSVVLNNNVSLVALEKSQIPEQAVRREEIIDQTRRAYRLVLDGISVPVSQVLPDANLNAIEQVALLLLSAESAGGMRACLTTIVDYLNTRKAFDRFIGSYQALKHPAADILLAAEAARSHVYHAATIIDSEDEQAVESAVRMAKAQSSEAFAFAGDRAVQFHGGFGFTYECDAQLFLRRAMWCQYQFGDERYHRQKLATLLFDEEVMQ